MILMAYSIAIPLTAQDSLLVPLKMDSSFLKEVSVTAFESNTNWKNVPASLAVISGKDLARYSKNSLLPELNAIPGIRMEERSPLSYRLSIRGSLLRSPFGVRNIKIYWNEIPLTDAGGNTYLNFVDPGQITGAEILKGPVASMYGAGTGGALLLKSVIPFNRQSNNEYSLEITGGSYGMLQQQLGWKFENKYFSSSLTQSHLQNDGYREQSASRRDLVNWNATLRSKKQALSFLLLYGNLYYQTPGAITLSQFQQDPKLSRQSSGALPGSAQQKAAVYNNIFLAGIQDKIEVNRSFELKAFLTGNSDRFTNPFITNYEKRNEDNIGFGLKLNYHTENTRNEFHWMNGIEWLYNHSYIQDFGNRSGEMDTVQFKDDIITKQWFIFSQASFNIAKKWNLTAGVSINNQLFHYSRISGPSGFYADKSIKAILTPRVALLYNLTNEISLYALAAKGFSPPTLAEIRPSDQLYHGELGAEYGWNYEFGLKGSLFNRRLYFDLAGYYFSLKNAIVRRNNNLGAEYFVNAGGTIQKGLEANLKYKLLGSEMANKENLHIWASYSYQPYRFDNYHQGTIDYSGNQLTGVPGNMLISGVDFESGNSFYVNFSANCTSKLPLTDANDAYASAYQLLQIKSGHKWNRKKIEYHFYVGIDNVLNQVYSLGNDINAAGKRYYNAAYGRNVFVGMQFQFGLVRHQILSKNQR